MNGRTARVHTDSAEREAGKQVDSPTRLVRMKPNVDDPPYMTAQHAVHGKASMACEAMMISDAAAPRNTWGSGEH